MSNQTIILGANGRIGRMLAQMWSADGSYRFVSRKDLGDWASEASSQELADCLAGAGAVLVLAGATPVNGVALDTNARVARAVCAAASGHGCHLFFASTMAVYGNAPGPHNEDGPCNPGNAYGASKLEMEREVLRLAEAPGLRVTLLRISNVLGADALGVNLNAGAEITLDQFADGSTPARSYVDPVRLSLVLEGLFDLAKEGTLLPQALNIASVPVLSMGDVAEAAGATVNYRPAPADARASISMDIGRLSSLVPAAAEPVNASQAVAAWQRLRCAT